MEEGMSETDERICKELGEIDIFCLPWSLSAVPADFRVPRYLPN
jgi:hypothetical protein